MNIHDNYIGHQRLKDMKLGKCNSQSAHLGGNLIGLGLLHNLFTVLTDAVK